jgi:hypothetical protein
MDELKAKLAPLTDHLPEGVRDFLDGGGWWLVLAVLALLGVAVLVLLVRGLERLFGRRKVPARKDDELHFDLAGCPLPVTPPGDPHLACYHLPVRLRLVVIAPPGRDTVVDAFAVEKLLDRVIPGLGNVARHDRPFIRVWPAQLSQSGFAATFHRCARRPEPEGEPSRWVLVAGRVQVGKQPYLLGLGLWADEANTVGRLTLEPHQWLDVLRLRSATT